VEVESPARAVMRTETDRPALLVRAVKYDPDWRVTAGGKPLELLRVNGIFQGAVIPAGSQTVEWSYRPSRTPVWLAVAGRLTLLLGLGVWFGRGRREAAP
jgi:uncharacterized membrane protein YfhO